MEKSAVFYFFIVRKSFSQLFFHELPVRVCYTVATEPTEQVCVKRTAVRQGVPKRMPGVLQAGSIPAGTGNRICLDDLSMHSIDRRFESCRWDDHCQRFGIMICVVNC